MLYSRDLAAVLPIMPEFCWSFAAQRQDHYRGVMWCYSRCDTEDGADIDVCGLTDGEFRGILEFD